MRELLTIMIILFVGLPGMAFSQHGLDLSSDKVPRGFKGDDIIGVVEALSKTIWTVDGHRRINLSDKKDVDRIYFFKLSDDVVYANQNGVWINKSTDGISPRYTGPQENYYLIKDMGKKKKQWTGQNVFGARVNVNTTREVRYFVTPIRGTDNIKKIAATSEGGKIGVLFIGKPAEHKKGDGYISYCGQSYGATFQFPYETYRKFYSVRIDLQEVWVYDQDSGRVLLKQKGGKIDYAIKVDELHEKMAREFQRIAQSTPSVTTPILVAMVIDNVKGFIRERDKLKSEAIEYYNGKLPPDLSKKFLESELKTEEARKVMQKAGARW